MALVHLVRETPEKGQTVTSMNCNEEYVEKFLKRGWKVEGKSGKQTEPVKEPVKEPAKEPEKSEEKPEKSEKKASSKKRELRDEETPVEDEDNLF